MRAELNPCYILHNRNYRETSLLLDVFSRRYGRLSLLAKGARKQKNDKRALLQPGRKINIAWSMRRELGTLTGVEPCHGINPQEAGGLLTVFYINELLVRLLHRHEPHPELFDAYAEALAKLTDSATEQATLRLFEKRLLEALGYGLALETDTEGNAISPDQYYTYLPEQGPAPGAAPDPGALQISGRTLLALAEENLGDEIVLTEAKQLMRKALGGLLGDKPLASRELYRFTMNIEQQHNP
ncbi:MAG: DNA repair protein RecO [Gammaproteobacteria bacterium]|nr:DNA repair protein RecO [Gammaproteobacteria bacterium]MDE0283934.1 DNA repair protein RecO [Gammaproteobacteria bacterium]MDE0512712.1 DNA repair protein RecO [Gammaproteobacteria bacterium]